MPRPRREIPWLQVRDGVYYVYWHNDQSGRTQRISLRTSDGVEAQQRYAAFLQQGHAIFNSGRTAGLGVGAALDQYWREHVQPNVVDKGRQEDAIHHLKAWFKDQPIIEIDIPASRAYADARRMGVIGGGRRRHRGEGSDSTIRRELVVLQAAANHAARWKRIGPSATPPTAMPSIELPPEAPPAVAPWLTRDELKRATETATGALKDFMVVAYYTAGRRASVEALTRFQVDLKEGRINLRGANEDVNQRRSKKRRPVVPIDPLLRPTLERLLADSPNEWLFGKNRSFYRHFHRHMIALGFPDEKCHPHILRHSRATHLLQSGVPIYDVARLLGDTVATVERVYGHHSVEYLAETIKRRTE